MYIKIKSGDLEVEFEGSLKDWLKAREGIRLETKTEETKVE